jgi:hypothetical protein
MSNYKITTYSRDKIDELNKKLNTDEYSIRPSADPQKKIDVLLRNDVIASVGDPNLPDYPTYIETEGMDVAKKRRTAFYSRFRRLPDIKNGEITPMFWSRWLLW